MIQYSRNIMFSNMPYYRGLILSMLFILTASYAWAQIPPPPPIEIPINSGGSDGNISINPDMIDAPTAAEIEKAQQNIDAENKVKEKIAQDKEAQQKEENVKDILALKRQQELPKAKIWGQQFFRDESISIFTRDNTKAIDSYELDVGDALIITVWGAVDFSKSTQISEEGFIDLSIPDLLVPRLYIKGMKLSDARKVIYERLSRHMNMRGSLHDIQLNYSRSMTINITGEVFNPGSYTIPATNTAFNALVASGGPSQIGSVRRINVVSNNRSTRILDVYNFITNPNIADEFFLSNNDYIFVPLAERVVSIEGSVKRPYSYELIEGEHLQTLLKFAGGLNADAYLRNIQIRRYAQNEERIIDINLGKLLQSSEDFELFNGDIVTISPIKEAYSNYVTVSGAVKLPGEYELVQGDRIRDVLQKSGIMLSAVMKRIYVQRIRPDFSIEYISVNVDSIMSNSSSESNILLRALDKIEIKFKSNFVDQYDIQLFGAVREPGAYPYSDSLSLYDLIYLANGIQNEAANSVVEISRLKSLPDGTSKTTTTVFEINENLDIVGAEDFTLEPYDQVFVRLTRGFELPRNVRIEGEVFHPGNYTILGKNERISDLIKRAGGISSVAFLKGAKLTRPEKGFIVIDLEEVIDNPDSRFNYYLEEGDELIIPRIESLIMIAGRINHPEVKDQSEIDEINLKVDLRKAKTDVDREEILAKEQISKKLNPPKINVPYHKRKRAKFYIKEYAGGIDWQNGGRSRLVYVRYPSGAVKKTRNYLFFKRYPKVEQGCMVYVDTKTKKDRKNQYKGPKATVDWSKTISNAFALTTSALTILIAIRTLNR